MKRASAGVPKIDGLRGASAKENEPMVSIWQGIKDRIKGKTKRAVGEFAARPDIVLEGERQEMRGRQETLEARHEENSKP